MDSFNHERMDVYNLMVDFAAITDEIVIGLPRGRSYLADKQEAARCRPRVDSAHRLHADPTHRKSGWRIGHGHGHGHGMNDGILWDASESF